MIAAVSAAALTLSSTAFAQQPSQFGTADLAQAMLVKAVAAVKADKTKALNMFVRGEGRFPIVLIPTYAVLRAFLFVDRPAPQNLALFRASRIAALGDRDGAGVSAREIRSVVEDMTLRPAERQATQGDLCHEASALRSPG